MATADEILATMSAEEEKAYLVIESDLRTITIPDEIKILGVESDDDVLRLHFKMPKMYGEFDLSEFELRVNYLNANNEPDLYEVKDAAVSGDVIEFSWLVGRTAAKFKGDVKFIVCAKLIKADGVVEKEFNTTTAKLPVLEGLETSETVVQLHPDIIEAILLRLSKLETSGGVTDEQIANALSEYLAENPVQPGATQEQAEQIEANKKAIEELQKGGTGGGITAETDPTVPAWAKQPSKPTYTAAEVGALPATTQIPTVPETLPNPQPIVINGVSYDGSEKKEITITAPDGGIATETDPTVPAWAKQPSKPTYTASEVGALPATTQIPTVPEWAQQPSKPTYTAAEVGALPATTQIPTVPETLPNPQPIVINGVSYDGSVRKEITVQAEAGAGIDDTTPSTETTYSSSKIDALLNEQKGANDAQDEAIAKKLDASELPTAINTALAQAKESGQFDGAPGAPGYTPQKGVDYFDGKDGEPGDPGEPGKDYVLTEADKEEIAEMAAEKVEVPEGGGSYTLPIASPDVLGGVKPAAKTDSMTQEIGVDADGKLWGLPGGGGRNWELIADITLTELVRMIEITKDLDGNPFSLSEIVIDASTKQERADGEDFTGNRNLQVIINSGGAGWFNLKFSSGTEFVPFFAHYQAIGGVVFGYAKRTVEKVAASYSSKVEANAVNTQRADAINSISIDSEYIHVNGTQNRFSLGTSVKIYGVRT